MRKFNSEAMLHQQVCEYLKLRYPSVHFRTDFAAGTKMTIGQAIQHRRSQSSRAWPDLQIVEPRAGYHGLFIELKAEGAALYKKDGTLSGNAHIQEQYELLLALHRKGYRAVFAQGFAEAQATIDAYLSLPDAPQRAYNTKEA